MRHVRRLLLIGCVLAVVLAPAGRALAAPAPTAQAFTCLGKVPATDEAAGTITMTVKCASTALQGSVGQSLTLTVTSGSVLTAISRSPKAPIALADVPVGDMIAVRGTIEPGSDPAVCDVTRAALWRPCFRARFLCLGSVSSVDLQANALVVHVARGSVGLRDVVGTDTTMLVPAQARIFVVNGHRAAAATIGQVTAGDRVCIGGRADRTNADAPVFVASFVVVRHVAPVGRLRWFACRGQVSAVDAGRGMVTLTVTRGTRAVQTMVGGSLTLATTTASVISTLQSGVLTTLPVDDVPVGDAIVVTGTIDRSDPSTAVFDIGRAFVWPPMR
jgi:hypothetical protein